MSTSLESLKVTNVETTGRVVSASFFESLEPGEKTWVVSFDDVKSGDVPHGGDPYEATVFLLGGKAANPKPVLIQIQVNYGIGKYLYRVIRAYEGRFIASVHVVVGNAEKLSVHATQDDGTSHAQVLIDAPPN